MDDITDSDYRHAKRVLKYLNNKNLGDFMIFVSLADVF